MDGVISANERKWSNGFVWKFMSHVIGDRDHDHRHYSALLKVGKKNQKHKSMEY